jgi:hypothetical protein
MVTLPSTRAELTASTASSTCMASAHACSTSPPSRRPRPAGCGTAPPRAHGWCRSPRSRRQAGALHGLGNGTDAGSLWFSALAVGCALTVAGAVTRRLTLPPPGDLCHRAGLIGPRIRASEADITALTLPAALPLATALCLDALLAGAADRASSPSLSPRRGARLRRHGGTAALGASNGTHVSCPRARPLRGSPRRRTRGSARAGSVSHPSSRSKSRGR